MKFPRKYFVTKGSGLSDLSLLNAFDAALIDAKIDEYNIIRVSSILPRNIERVEIEKMEAGMIVPMVLARENGNDEEFISAGLAWGEGSEGSFGFVVEHHASLLYHNVYKKTSQQKIGEMLESLRQRTLYSLKMKLERSISIRNLKLKNIDYMTSDLFVPKGMYGCVLVALVFLK